MILKKADIVLIIALVVFAAAFYFIFGVQGEAGVIVRVTVDGKLYAELPLSDDAELVITQSLTHTNTLLITNGRAVMSYADCPDGLCLKHEPVYLSGEMIICLPNRVVIEVVGDKTELDAVA